MKTNPQSVIKYFNLFVKNIKVAYLLGSLNRGGTETLLLDVFRQHNEAPFNMILIYRKEGDLIDEFRNCGGRMFHLNPGRPCNLLVYLWKLRKKIVQEEITILHSQQYLDTVYAWLACLGLPTKVIQTMHGYDFYTSPSAKILLKLSFIMADQNLFVSRAQKQYFIEKYNHLNHLLTSVVYNGISFDKFKEHKSENYIRRELNISMQGFLMGTVGNFVPDRDQMTTCRFLALLNKQGFDFVFIFIGKKDPGNPDLYDSCVSYCELNALSGKVLFLGSRADVPEILPQLDAFIYSTNQDTFGIAVIEALACRLPVFVNDWEVMKEITDCGKYAYLYKTKDEYDLLKIFLNFLDNRGSYQKNAEDASSWVRDTFSIGKHFSALKEEYSRLI